MTTPVTMLKNQIDATPRPPPPANARQASASLKSTPPPPYIATPNASRNEWERMRLHIPLSSAVTDEWLNERARGDLAQLLSKADEVIKERENDMGVTSAARKSLQEDSLILKIRHEEFLRRISSPCQTPPASIAASPTTSALPLPTSPHYYSANLSHLTTDPNINESLLHPRCTRRISVSPNDIALLSDENAELLSKLEKLEADSAQADLAGRRKLRKLEKEIQGLREELEQTQVKSEELEEKAKISVDAEKVADEIWRKKMEREEKCRAMRGKPDSDSGGDRVRDFAPGSTAIPSGSSPHTTPVKQVLPSTTHLLNTPPAFRFPKRPVDRDDQDDVFLARSRPLSTSERELAVVSQLLLKIRELEEANAQITDQQAKTAATLHSVHKDAESIRRVYEGLGDTEGVEWEIVADADHEKGSDEKRPVDDETIRFQSFRRKLNGTPSRSVPTSEDYFADGIAGNMQSTINDAALNRIISNHKERKSVVGLFDTPRTSDPSSLRITDLPVPFATDADRPGWPTNDTLHSPALSTLSISAPSPINERGPTLGSELGSEFGDEWGAAAGNHHLRNTSLYQLAMPSTPSSPAPTSHLAQAGGTSNNVSRELPKPQTASFRVHRDIQPSQDQFAPSEGDKPRRRHQTDRYQRMSQTIRSRTNQWADGRFKETLLGSKNITPGQPSEGAETRKPSSIPSRLAGVFDSVVGTLAGPGGREVATSEVPNDDDYSRKTKADTRSTNANPPDDNPKGVTKVIFELWLWLQFCIIILVFLWAMAKRGPKNVLEDAEKRRVSTRHRF